jgi:ferritin-like metal-binding protein YciE
MELDHFGSMYVAELQELVSAERQLTASLLGMSGAASHPTLKSALVRHRQQTHFQVERLDAILWKHGVSSTAHTDQAMQSLLNETEKMLAMLQGNELRDAGLISSVQKIVHYEIAAYGTAAALAGQLGLRDEQELLHRGLEEEKQTDFLLTQLAKREVNPEAVDA